jgi:tRNA wybutosine-synthesizing protein 3
MQKDTFLQRKKSVLLKADKSSKGKWDRRMIPLCNKINSFKNYYTTSSCSGRVVILIDKDKKECDLFLKVYHDLISLNNLKRNIDKIKRNNLIKFKQEPCILHVACRTLEDAKDLMDKGKLAGWKKSGVISLGKKIIVELSRTEKLEFPIIENRKILVDNYFLRSVVEKSNENLKNNWKNIDKLKELLDNSF